MGEGRFSIPQGGRAKFSPHVRSRNPRQIRKNRNWCPWPDSQDTHNILIQR